MRKILIGLCAIVFFCAWNGWNGRVSRPAVRYSILAGYTDVTTNMTANDAPEPLVVSADSETASYTTFEAFDGVTNTSLSSWLSGSATSNHWIKYDWGTNRNYVISRYTIQNASNSTWGVRGRVCSWNLYASNNGGARVLLDTKTGQGDWDNGEIRTFTIVNDTAYRYYLFDNFINTNQTYLYVCIEEIRWLRPDWD